MRLDSVPMMDPGGPHYGGNTDLIVNQDDLGAVGHDAFELFNRLEKDGKHARKESGEAAGNLMGNSFELGIALDEVNATWDNQLSSLLDACAHISNHLDYTAKSHKAEDEWIAASMPVSKINDILH